eukprot:1535942-Prymnesium_polylepis.1
MAPSKGSSPDIIEASDKDKTFDWDSDPLTRYPWAKFLSVVSTSTTPASVRTFNTDTSPAPGYGTALIDGSVKMVPKSESDG